MVGIDQKCFRKTPLQVFVNNITSKDKCFVFFLHIGMFYLLCIFRYL